MITHAARRITLTLLALLLVASLGLATRGHGASTLRYAGVNLAGAEFGESNLPGVYNTDYTYPTRAEVDYFLSKGMNIFRLPFRWERLQRTLSAPLDPTELARLDSFVSYATGQNAFVIIEPHNYARYNGGLVGTDVPVAAFADFWARVATHYKANNHVFFNLVNEPHTMPSELWRDNANAAIQAIRDAGASNLILVPGNAWTGAFNWSADWYGTPNATVMLGIVDPGDNYAFEVHQYLDTDGSGTSPNCVSSTIGAERLAGFSAWLRANNRRGFLGEFAGGPNPTCYSAMTGLLDHLEANADIWLGWTYWAAGPWWGDYMFTLEPDSSGSDRPQMAVLLPHLPPLAPPSPTATSGLPTPVLDGPPLYLPALQD